MNYGDLKRAIHMYTEDESQELVNAMDTIVDQAEENIFRLAPDLSCFQKRFSYGSTTSTINDNRPTIGGIDFTDSLVNDGSDMVMVRSVFVTSPGFHAGYLENAEESFIRNMYPNLTTNDESMKIEFFFIDGNKIYLAPVPATDTSVSMTVKGIGRLDKLSTRDDMTNWISENAERTILNAALAEASDFLHRPEAVIMYRQKLAEEISLLQNDITRSRKSESGALL